MSEHSDFYSDDHNETEFKCDCQSYDKYDNESDELFYAIKGCVFWILVFFIILIFVILISIF